MQVSRHLAAIAVLAGTVAGTAAFTQPASAASAAATYNGVCGSGYKVVNSAPIGSSGTVFLTYNSSNGKNCVVTIRNTSGSPQYMFAYLGVSGTGDAQVDEGSYRSYAGPVYVYGRGVCLDWAGGIANQETWTYGSNCAALKAQRVTVGW
jgi:hypothetical protein